MTTSARPSTPHEGVPIRGGRARTLWLNDPGWDGYLILDVVDKRDRDVEVLCRSALD
jgi:hypothetical protein